MRKPFSEFFRIFFEVSDKSHSAKKFKRGTLWDFLNIHSVAKYQKIDGGSFGATKKIREKNEKFEQSHSAEKRGESLIVSRKVERGPFCFGMAFYLILEVLDALKMKY